jgi:hypothetical protein
MLDITLTIADRENQVFKKKISFLYLRLFQETFPRKAVLPLYESCMHIGKAGSSVGIVTGYRLDTLGTESWCE